MLSPQASYTDTMHTDSLQYLNPAMKTIGVTSGTQVQAFNFGTILVYLVFTVSTSNDDSCIEDRVRAC